MTTAKVGDRGEYLQAPERSVTSMGMVAATTGRSNRLVHATPLPQIVEKLERLTFTGDRSAQIRPGVALARRGVAELIMGNPETGFAFALEAMSDDARWWDLAVEIGQWCA